jgi:hypothetical protein
VNGKVQCRRGQKTLPIEKLEDEFTRQYIRKPDMENEEDLKLLCTINDELVEEEKEISDMDKENKVRVKDYYENEV